MRHRQVFHSTFKGSVLSRKNNDLQIRSTHLLRWQRDVYVRRLYPFVAVMSNEVSSNGSVKRLYTRTNFYREERGLYFFPDLLFVNFRIAFGQNIAYMPDRVRRTRTGLTRTNMYHIRIKKVRGTLCRFIQCRFSNLMVTNGHVRRFLFSNGILRRLKKRFRGIPVRVNPTWTSMNKVNGRAVRTISRFIRRNFCLTRNRRDEFILYQFNRIRRGKCIKATILANLFIGPLFLMTNRPNSQTLTYSKIRINVRRNGRFPIFIRSFMNVRVLVVGKGVQVLLRNSTVRPNYRTRCTLLRIIRLGMETRRLVISVRLPIFRFVKVMHPIPQRRSRIFSFHLTYRNLRFYVFLFNNEHMDLRRLIRRLVRKLAILYRTLLRIMFNRIIVTWRLNGLRASVNRFLCGFRIVTNIIVHALHVMNRVWLATRIATIYMNRGETVTKDLRNRCPTFSTFFPNYLYDNFCHTLKRPNRL